MNAFWWALLAAGIWGVTSIIEKYALFKIEPIPSLFYRCAGVLLGLFVLFAFMLKPSQIKAVDLRSASLLFIAGFLGSFVAFIAFYKALKIGEMSMVVPVSASFFLISFLLGIFVLGETLTWMKGIGVFLIAIGVWMLGSGTWVR
ncbi:MAG: EamA family transporter [Candidatus Omnitrophota bacterium]